MRATLFDDQRNDLWRIDVDLPCSDEKIRILMLYGPGVSEEARRLVSAINDAESVMTVPNSW